MPDKKTCFVVMGFGEKTDYEQGKTFDLDKTYRVIIKKAVEEAGLRCIRADDVIHSGSIDKEMYELLLEADIVVADLSTANPNAIYELGVRHALRPNTTIVMAEENFKFPFDLSDVVIRTYEHLGKGIDAEVADEMRNNLKTAILELVDGDKIDSPVYTFLNDLERPRRVPVEAGARGLAERDEAKQAEAPPKGESLSELMELFRAARMKGDWAEARKYLKKVSELTPNDPFVQQQLALATYKSKQPDTITALKEAHEIVTKLGPDSTNDPETLGLWGAIHKRLWELEEDRAYLDEAIRSYEKGFYLKDDNYNGINYAFLLNVRSSVSDGSEAVADFVQAERVRRQVIRICRALLEAGVKDDEGNPDKEALFWIRATLVEALTGIGLTDEAEEIKAQALAEAPEPWMPDSMEEQLVKLKGLLAAPPGGPE